MKLLDLFCGAGGVATGYHRAGFDVVGVDIAPQPHFPFEFVQADALEVLEWLATFGHVLGRSFDVVHASCPCQAHTDLQKQSKRDYPDLIAPTRELLQRWGGPYVIENVEGAPLIDPVMICGASIPGLRVIRHRLFESNVPLEGVPCPERHPLVFTHDKRKAHHGRLDQDVSFVQVTGGGNATVANKLDAMGVPWMTGAEANEAIPPAYTERVGAQLMAGVCVPRRLSFDDALEWILISSTWHGGYLRVRLGSWPAHEVCYRRWRDQGQFGDLPGLVRQLEDDHDDEVLLGLPVSEKGHDGPAVVSLLWARIEGNKQLAYAKAHRPLPSMILLEGTSTRRWLLWFLEEKIQWLRAAQLNRRLAYAFRAVQKHADPDTLWLPAPGTCRRDGKARPVPIRVPRFTLDTYFAGDVAGALRDPPEPTWMER